MTDLKKLRKRNKKNWKREQKAKYRRLMSLAKLIIENASDYYCYLKSPCKDDDYFALWLVAKKLEAKGFKCRLKILFSSIFNYDELRISWEK